MSALDDVIEYAATEDCDEEIVSLAIGELAALRAEREWVSVKDRLPERGDLIVAYDPDYSNFDVFRYDPRTILDYTHWMKLPEPPK